MSIETAREEFGATARGLITIIEKDVEDLDVREGAREDEVSKHTATKKEYTVREGGRTLIVTDDKKDAIDLAKMLGRSGGMVAPGVDERMVSEVAGVAPHEHRIPTHEIRPASESHLLSGDEPERLEPSGPIAHVNPALEDHAERVSNPGKVANPDQPITAPARGGPSPSDADPSNGKEGPKPANAGVAAAEGKLGSTDGNATAKDPKAK